MASPSRLLLSCPVVILWGDPGAQDPATRSKGTFPPPLLSQPAGPSPTRSLPPPPALVHFKPAPRPSILLPVPMSGSCPPSCSRGVLGHLRRGCNSRPPVSPPRAPPVLPGMPELSLPRLVHPSLIQLRPCSPSSFRASGQCFSPGRPEAARPAGRGATPASSWGRAAPAEPQGPPPTGVHLLTELHAGAHGPLPRQENDRSPPTESGSPGLTGRRPAPCLGPFWLLSACQRPPPLPTVKSPEAQGRRVT